MNLPILNEADIFTALCQRHNPFFKEYYAFYSSWFGGIITNPQFMLLPMDDHMVHRGDGVFEAMKAVNRSVYLFDQHLERLYESAKLIDLNIPYQEDELKTIILKTLTEANQKDAAIRVFLSRGPGNFSVNPYDSLGTQLYVVITKLNRLAETKYQQGVKIVKSHIPLKSSWMNKIKSCNYLPNVLMKKEAVDRHVDFVISVDEQGYIAEGSTENIVIIDQQGHMVHPILEHILRGTTMVRVFELAKNIGITTEVRRISVDELLAAKEVFLTGTTIDVLPVVEVEGQKIGTNIPGEITRKLHKLIIQDIHKTRPCF